MFVLRKIYIVFEQLVGQLWNAIDTVRATNEQCTAIHPTCTLKIRRMNNSNDCFVVRQRHRQLHATHYAKRVVCSIQNWRVYGAICLPVRLSVCLCVSAFDWPMNESQKFHEHTLDASLPAHCCCNFKSNAMENLQSYDSMFRCLAYCRLAWYIWMWIVHVMRSPLGALRRNFTLPSDQCTTKYFCGPLTYAGAAAVAPVAAAAAAMWSHLYRLPRAHLAEQQQQH